MPQNTPIATVCPINLKNMAIKKKVMYHYWTDAIMQNHLPQ